jgi:hypothetical protein
MDPGYTVRPVISSRRFSSVLIIALMALASAPLLDGFEEDSARAPLSCVHEMAYEAFAGLVLVTVTIEDSPPLQFVVDSGATQSSISDPFLARALGLEVKEAGLARGVGSGAARVLVADEICVRIDGVEVLRSPLVVHDIGGQLAAMAGREIDGFLGADLFENYVVEINPAGGRLLLHNPEAFGYEGDGYVVPLEVADGRPLVEAAVIVREGKKEIPVRLLADTGSSRALSLITRSRRHLKPPDEIRRFRLGLIIAENVETAWMDAFRVPAVRNIEDLNGILGNQILSRFRAIFDYRGGRLILEPIRPSRR